MNTSNEKDGKRESKRGTIPVLDWIIERVARVLAMIMALVIIWGVADVLYVLYLRLMAPPFMLLEIKDILATFGAFMAVLIAIEIYHISFCTPRMTKATTLRWRSCLELR